MYRTYSTLSAPRTRSTIFICIAVSSYPSTSTQTPSDAPIAIGAGKKHREMKETQEGKKPVILDSKCMPAEKHN